MSRAWLLVAVALLAAVLGSGIYLQGRSDGVAREQVRQEKVLKERLKAQREQDERARVITTTAAAATATVQAKTVYLTKEVPVYVTKEIERDCAPGPGVVWLLDNARDLELSTAPIRFDGESGAAAEVGFGDIIRADIDTVGRYNALMIRHNALLDWIDAHYGKDPQGR